MTNEERPGPFPAGKCWCGKRIHQRLELPDRRGGENFDFIHRGFRYSASVRYPSDSSVVPAEIFLNSEKIASSNDLVARDAAIVISVALQYGVPLDEMAHALGRDEDGAASSPIGKLLDILLGRDK